jgi:hypothetical protein
VTCGQSFRLAEDVYACPEGQAFHHEFCWSSTNTCGARSREAQVDDDADRMPCPHCTAPIKKAAKLCRFCKRMVDEAIAEDILAPPMPDTPAPGMSKAMVFVIGLSTCVVVGVALGTDNFRNLLITMGIFSVVQYWTNRSRAKR